MTTRKRKAESDEVKDISAGMYDFRKCVRIGKGTYGIVYKAYDAKRNLEIAIKRIPLDSKEGVPGTCLREVSILKELNHPNIVKLLDVAPSEGYRKLNLIFEYVDDDLSRLLKRIHPTLLPMPYIKSFLWQLLRALSHCHANRVLHRDLKPENILVQINGTVKLADFGLARSFSIPSRRYTHEIVTLWYRAPEILLRSRYYSTAVDIWSLACVFAELVTSTPLFFGQNELDLLLRIFEVLGTPTEETWPELVECLDYKANFPIWTDCILEKSVPGLNSDGLDLLAQMLLYPPEERMTSKAALSHRFLRDVPLSLEPITKLLETCNKPSHDEFGEL